jgi:hypothetical protein
MKKKTYRTAVVWGESPTTIGEYEFETAAELKAFWEGVEAATGWLEVSSIEDVLSDDHSLKTYAENSGQSVTEAKKELRAAIRWEKNE